jgi:hypothetical protein
MGSWGVGVFSDDLALDIRGEWRDALLRREDPVAISRRMAAGLEDGDDTTCWIALAAAQHETGHLQPDVRDRALEVIAAGTGLELWDESGLLDARRAVLARLAAKLRGPQPKPKRLRGPRSVDPGVAIGDVVRIHDERRTVSVLFAVVGMSHEIAKQPCPLLLGLFTDPDGPIDAEALATAPYLSDLDFTAFDGEEPPEHMGIAHPALTWVLTSARHRLSDVGEIVARGVTRSSHDLDDDDCGSMTTWRGVQAIYCNERTMRILRRVTERRVERYGPGDGALREELSARIAEHEIRLREAAAIWGELRSRTTANDDGVS